MSKRITIYDLANQLGLSPATVSRSLNGHPSISDNTKKMVLELAKEKGYRTNKFASNLSRQQSNTIGVIVPKLNSYFMSTVLAGIEQVANKVGYNLIISQSQESEEKEKINATTLLNSGVDALLVSLANESNDYEHFEAFTSRKIPLLFFDRVIDLPQCPTILIDNLAAGFDAGQHLVDQGCKNPIHVSGNLKRTLYADRFKGFQQALLMNGFSLHADQLIETGLDPIHIEEVISHIKRANKKIDGLFVASDNFAAHCIIALQREGFRVPEDIKVVGFNNDPVCEIVSPNLTTIEYPGYKMGTLAGESIIAHLNGNINLQTTNTILVRHKLIIRSSTSK
ncbi:LacI family DNA-binding transcriptional regulator [Maribacter sp. 4G9]|uniref:LacI family DNA-binding transcriptional regulator n=1 Tax=Maribacter sp. 4G9 TaxID=1889777 RepID=UPI000C1542E8|nr:LacI family DNA-binding transcriptional regulator [Maribacter sp. 4G9]PIB28529.1 LacI family transcriptional regulator [Maribacter sp. 4G9]